MANTTQTDPSRRWGAKDDGSPRMSFFEHLTELRARLIRSFIAIAIGLILGTTICRQLFEFVAKPMIRVLHEMGMEDKLVYLSPLGPLRLYLTVGLYFGLVIASPYVFYQLWLFVAPGLYRNERRAVLSFVSSAVFLFLSGMAFGYYVLLPITLKFLISFPGSDFRALISMNEYFDMTLVILLGLGLIFQLPILIFILSLFGIVTPRFLWNNFRYAILIISIIAAVVTPTTDPFTMLIFMAPMVVLYLLGIGVSALVIRKRARREAVASADAP